MCNEKKYPLSLNGDTFNALKADFDQQLRQLLTEMEKRESEDATINIKIAVNLSPDQERDFEANGYDAMKDIVKPSFKHEVSTVMQVKSKKSGSLSGNYKLVWDRELCQYVMQEIDNGQMSVFDKAEEPQMNEPVGLPSADVIDTDYEVVGDEESEADENVAKEAEDGSMGAPAVSDSPYEYMKQFIGVELRVMESMGNYTVRTYENRVVLSSAFNESSPFYCSASSLKPHISHRLECVSLFEPETGKESIDIICQYCEETIFGIYKPETADADADDGYEYTEPTQEDE